MLQADLFDGNVRIQGIERGNRLGRLANQEGIGQPLQKATVGGQVIEAVGTHILKKNRPLGGGLLDVRFDAGIIGGMVGINVLLGYGSPLLMYIVQIRKGFMQDR